MDVPLIEQQSRVFIRIPGVLIILLFKYCGVIITQVCVCNCLITKERFLKLKNKCDGSEQVRKGNSDFLK